MSNSTRGALYVPPGRRDLVGNNGIQDDIESTCASTNKIKISERKCNKPSEVEVSVTHHANTNIECALRVPPKVEIVKIQSDKQSTAMSEVPTNSERALYVPPGRRELNEKISSKPLEIDKSKLRNRTSVVEEQKPVVLSSMECDSSFLEYTDENVLKCGLVVRGFPSEYPLLSKDQVASLYLDKGAAVRWVGCELVVMFKTESACCACLSIHSGTGIFQSTRLTEVWENFTTYLTVARELFTSLKPGERSSVVANRLISAALGIRMAAAPTSQNKQSRQRVNPPVDAWDD